MRCWLSAAQAAYHSFPSLPPTKTRSLRCTAFFPPKPLRWVSAGALLGEMIKLPFCIFGISMWGWYHYPLAALSVSEQPRAGFISAEKRFSQSGCSVPTDTLFPPAHSAFSALLCGGWYHYPRRALHAVETLDVRGSRRRIRRFYAAPEFALCGLNLPSSGTHATPAPNRAHWLTRRNRGASLRSCAEYLVAASSLKKQPEEAVAHLWRVSAFSGAAAPQGCGTFSLITAWSFLHRY